MSSPTVTVTIANWNSREVIEKCLDSIAAQTFAPAEVIVVDDASSDGSPALIAQKYPHVTILLNEVNSGFCKTQNRAIARARGELILALNQDVILTPTFIEHAVAAMQADPTIGTVSGKLLRTVGRGGPPLIDSAGHTMALDRVPANRGWEEVDSSQFEVPEYIFGARGAAPLYRRAMIDSILIDGEFFDESFNAYFDDVDVDWRAQWAGWTCFYAPRAVAYHIAGTSREKRLTQMEIHETKNRYLMMLKNDSVKNFKRDLPFIAMYELSRLLYFLLGRWHIARGYIGFFKLIGPTLRKRKIIMERRKITDDEMHRWFIARETHTERLVESLMMIYVLVVLLLLIPLPRLIAAVAGFFAVQWFLTTLLHALKPRV